MTKNKKKKKKPIHHKTHERHGLPKDMDKKVDAAVSRIVKEYGEVLKKLGDG